MRFKQRRTRYHTYLSRQRYDTCHDNGSPRVCALYINIQVYLKRSSTTIHSLSMANTGKYHRFHTGKHTTNQPRQITVGEPTHAILTSYNPLTPIQNTHILHTYTRARTHGSTRTLIYNVHRTPLLPLNVRARPIER